MDLVGRIHEEAYLRRLEQACADGASIIDVPDSAICPDSYRIARLAAGAVVNAMDGSPASMKWR